MPNDHQFVVCTFRINKDSCKEINYTMKMAVTSNKKSYDVWHILLGCTKSSQLKGSKDQISGCIEKNMKELGCFGGFRHRKSLL